MLRRQRRQYNEQLDHHQRAAGRARIRGLFQDAARYMPIVCRASHRNRIRCDPEKYRGNFGLTCCGSRWRVSSKRVTNQAGRT